MCRPQGQRKVNHESAMGPRGRAASCAPTAPPHPLLSPRPPPLLPPARQVLPPEEPLVEMKATDLLARRPALSLVALVAILDPPREEAIAAVKVAHKAGISVKMITGEARVWMERILFLLGTWTAHRWCCADLYGMQCTWHPVFLGARSMDDRSQETSMVSLNPPSSLYHPVLTLPVVPPTPHLPPAAHTLTPQATTP